MLLNRKWKDSPWDLAWAPGVAPACQEEAWADNSSIVSSINDDHERVELRTMHEEYYNVF